MRLNLRFDRIKMRMKSDQLRADKTRALNKRSVSGLYGWVGGEWSSFGIGQTLWLERASWPAERREPGRGAGRGDAENTLGEVQEVDQVAGLSPQRPSAERLLETLRGEPGLRPRGAVDSAPSWDSSFPATVLALWTPSSGPGT